MKQIQFRTIDAILIKFSLNGKFWVVCSLVALITSVIALMNYQQTTDLIAQSSLQRVKASAESYASVANNQGLTNTALEQFAQTHQLQLSGRDNTFRSGDQVTASASVGDQFLSVSQNVQSWEQEPLSQSYFMLII
ncbi:MAG: methyl-accepting chemotaxis protein, partial [Shewanella sp. CG_4_10_14_0_8_um_filter_42_13]